MSASRLNKIWYAPGLHKFATPLRSSVFAIGDIQHLLAMAESPAHPADGWLEFMPELL